MPNFQVPNIFITKDISKLIESYSYINSKLDQNLNSIPKPILKYLFIVKLENNLKSPISKFTSKIYENLVAFQIFKIETIAFLFEKSKILTSIQSLRKGFSPAWKPVLNSNCSVSLGYRCRWYNN